MDSRLRFVLIAAGIGLLLYFFVFKHGEAPHASTRQLIAPPALEARGAEENWVRLHARGTDAWVTTYSGTLRNVRLTTPQFRGQMVTTVFAPHDEDARPMRATVAFERDGHNVLPHYLTYTVEESTESSVTLVAEPADTNVRVRRTIRANPRAEYSFLAHTEVTNLGAPGRVRYSEGVGHYVRRSEESGGFFRQSWQLSEGLCGHHDGHLYRESRDEIGKRGDNDNIATHARFVGLGNLYFLNSLSPLGSEPVACHLRSQDRFREGSEDPTGSMMYARLSWAPAELANGQSHGYDVLGYFGPKLSSRLRAADPILGEAVNLGFFAIIARLLLKLLQFLYSLTHNWGIAIILLTVIVRTALFPILARSTKSMAMMQKLKPDIDAINKKYADDANAKGLATMELYRKHKINPLAGCIPQLAQLPVWWALYTTLQTSVELFHAPFGPWKDLSAADPFFVLPLILGVVMFLQQKMMPPAMPDPVQAKIMLYFMPIFLTGISLFLPAGLALYMLVNSCLGIVQQKITKSQIERMSGAQGGAIEVRPADSEVLPPPGEPGSRKSGNGQGPKRDKRK